MMSSAAANYPSTTSIGGGASSNSNNDDPYLTDDFHPLALASTEILSALRADECAPDGDLYRRLISSSRAGAHRYHAVKGENGCGEVGGSTASSGGGDGIGRGQQQQDLPTSPRGGGSSSTSGGIGSPLGMLRGSRSAASATSGNNASTSNDQTTNPSSSLATSHSPPTSFLMHEKSLPLPNHLSIEAKKAQLSSMMGLLPEANLVWLSADEKLFLWSYQASTAASSSPSTFLDYTNTTPSSTTTPTTTNGGISHNTYEDRQDYCTFTVPSGQCIVSVGLVRPKPGVFHPTIVEWCVVVTTPEEVMLCALAKEDLSSINDVYPDVEEDGMMSGKGGRFRHGLSSSKLLRLIPTRFVLPTDSIPIMSIAGTSGGRIFLGGYDGNLYEMMYDGSQQHARKYQLDRTGKLSGSGSSSEALESAIDDYFDGQGIFALNHGGKGTKNNDSLLSFSGALSGGKRVFSALTFGSLDDDDDDGHGASITKGIRSRKCRKINHTSTASSFVSSVVPGAIIRVASGIFGSSMHAVAKDAGPVVNLVVDEERFCLYTLSAKGIICSYDILPLYNTIKSNGEGGGASRFDDDNNAPRLASVFDSISSAKLYLDSVSRGRMYPPSTSHSIALGTITFPGGEASAQAGVGGMEGAREILKRHEWEGRAAKAAAAASSLGGAGMRGVGDQMNASNTAGILHPVSIHLVPTIESKSLTLVAITGGGLRYYLSSLSSSYINSAQAMRGGFDYGARGAIANSKNIDPRLAKMRPGPKMTFCHIRAPPPYSSTDGNDGFRFELAPSAVTMFSSSTGIGGLPPGIHSVAGNVAGDVVKGCYSNGVFVLALDVEKKKSNRNTSGRGASSTVLGDVIVVAMPDFAARDSAPPNTTTIPGSQSNLGNSSNLVQLSAPQAIPGGISEGILLPMAGLGGTSTPALPGGRTFDIVTNTGNAKPSIITLFMNSETPSDSELQVGLMPSYFPQNKMPKRSSSSSAMIAWNDGRRGMISSALSALANYLRSGQGTGKLVGTVSQGAAGLRPSMTYRISRRHGCNSVGFSSSAAENLSTASRSTRADSASPTKSARLPSWLIQPSPAPLNSLASQHTLIASAGATSSQSVIILNSGGLHFFSNISLLHNLATVLLRASNVAKDGMVKNFFTSYGYADGCAMCFALVTSSSSSDVLRSKAENAALSYANRPFMKLTGPSAGDGIAPISSYTFEPSSLYEGLVKTTSRLLRPIWYKPAVVVTEGRPILSKSMFANYYASLPAKVELLLDDATLEEIRRPLLLLQNLMKKTFIRAVQSIPGLSTHDHADDAMDVDERGGNDADSRLITRAMQNRSRAAAAAHRVDSSQYATADELRSTAFRTEERNMHSLYRLLSRCVHLLNLLACLRRAHDTPALPEVQWGLLHGLSFYQLTSSQEGHQRIETLLNYLVSQGEKIPLNGLSPDGDLLAETLTRHCYLFFSSASRLTYLGFRSATDALSRPITSPQRLVLSNQAAAYLRAASRHWYTPALVAGRFVSKNENKSWDELAANAKEAGSPLALAADILMKLKNVIGFVDVCLICASNFGGSKVSRDERKELGEDTVQNMFAWERGLYHRPRLETCVNGIDVRPASAQAIVAGIDVTAADALQTCHGIIFHYVSKLLGEASESNQRLVDELVATCAASSDLKFVHSLYEHLMATNNAETALRIDNPSIENWLLNEKKDVSLMWKYYTLHGCNVLAGDIMWKQALNSEEKVPLEQRIEYLVRATNSYSSALGPSGHGTSRALKEEKVTDEMLQSRNAQIREQLEVATIQKLILTTVVQSEDVNLDSEKMDALSYSLMNVSELYNEFACPLNLFNVCLQILETCRHNDSENINTLWKSIICEEILPCQTNSEAVVNFLTRLKQGSMLEGETILFDVSSSNNAVRQFENGEWITRLRDRVASLGKELYGKGADYTFPLNMIVTELEGLRQAYDQSRGEDHVSSPWPAQTVLEVGVPFNLLLTFYDSRFHENNSDGGMGTKMCLKWLASISEFLELWVNAALVSYDIPSLVGTTVIRQSESASSEMIRAVNTGLLARIQHYKSALQSFDGSSVSYIEERFSKVEDTIRNEFC